MKVMPSVLGQVGQNVADSLFEIGKSAVKGTVGAVADIASGTVEQISATPGTITTQNVPVKEGNTAGDLESKKLLEKQRFEAVKGELALYIERKKQLDQKIAEEKAAESQQVKQKEVAEKREHDSWVSKVINRSQTTTEKGRMTE
jgi:hypothetical protein